MSLIRIRDTYFDTDNIVSFKILYKINQNTYHDSDYIEIVMVSGILEEFYRIEFQDLEIVLASIVAAKTKSKPKTIKISNILLVISQITHVIKRMESLEIYMIADSHNPIVLSVGYYTKEEIELIHNTLTNALNKGV